MVTEFGLKSMWNPSWSSRGTESRDAVREGEILMLWMGPMDPMWVTSDRCPLAVLRKAFGGEGVCESKCVSGSGLK